MRILATLQNLKSLIFGLVFTGVISVLSLFLAQSGFFSRFHISALIIGIILGVILSPLYAKVKSLSQKGIDFSAKKLLRLGIILYGFHITLEHIFSVGLSGIVLGIVVVSVVLLSGYIIGVKCLRLDKDIAILISGGSAICGAAAILALESSIRSQPYKGVIAVGVIVIFGLLGMFLYPA
ncbi:putative sulfate exporter family transporter, partial [uncultured Helicobacter sp.]